MKVALLMSLTHNITAYHHSPQAVFVEITVAHQHEGGAGVLDAEAMATVVVDGFI